MRRAPELGQARATDPVSVASEGEQGAEALRWSSLLEQRLASRVRRLLPDPGEEGVKKPVAGIGSGTAPIIFGPPPEQVKSRGRTALNCLAGSVAKRADSLLVLLPEQGATVQYSGWPPGQSRGHRASRG